MRVTCLRALVAPLFLCWTAGVAFSAPPIVTKVEPPDWWAGHTINPVRLLIRGVNLAGASLASSSGLNVSRVRTNGPGTYLFADLSIPAQQKPGDYTLALTTSEGTARVAFRVNAPLSTESRLPGFTPRDVVYLCMPDRFANGDPSNDNPAVSPGLFNRSNPFFYHGGDLQGIIDHLPYLKDLGVTAIWMTPIYDNSNRLGPPVTPNGPVVTDYHGYGAVDYYGVDEHFGTLALLQTLVHQAHALGLKVIQDQVENHVGPHHPWVADPPTPTWFHGTAARHIDENWQVWTLSDPASPQSLRRTITDGWFGNFLPDINQEDAEARQYEIQNTLWWLGEVGFDAIRQDTWPYVARDFWHDWMAAIKRQFPTVNVVGEVLDGDPVTVSFFQGGREHEGVDTLVDSLFDYPVYFKLREVFGQGKALREIPIMLGHDYLYPNPSLLWSIIGDHDVSRISSEPQASATNLKLALTCLFTVRGVPVLYYGDELGMQGGNDPDNRHDFPGGWSGDSTSAFLESGRTAQQQSIFAYVKKLAHLRNTVPGLSRPETTNLLVEEQHWVFARGRGSEIAIVAINNDSKPALLQIPVGSVNSKEKLSGLLGIVADAPISDALAQVTLPAKSAEIFVPAQH